MPTSVMAISPSNNSDCKIFETLDSQIRSTPYTCDNAFSHLFILDTPPENDTRSGCIPSNQRHPLLSRTTALLQHNKNSALLDLNMRQHCPDTLFRGGTRLAAETSAIPDSLGPSVSKIFCHRTACELRQHRNGAAS
jgi:hypothetical protein